MATYKAKKVMHCGDEIKLGSDPISYEWECLGSLCTCNCCVTFDGDEYKEFTVIYPYCCGGYSEGHAGYYVSASIPDYTGCGVEWGFYKEGCVCINKKGSSITVKPGTNISSNENNSVWGKKQIGGQGGNGFIDIMLIGAGGNGGYQGGGGGGGGVKIICGQPIYSTNISMKVGSGYCGCSGCCYGGASSIFNYSAGGGASATGYYCCSPCKGCCGSSGGGGHSSNCTQGSQGDAPGGNGGNGRRFSQYSGYNDDLGGGGGGAGGNGGTASHSGGVTSGNSVYVGATGGNGCTTDFTGITETFAGGGGGTVSGSFTCSQCSPSTVSITKGCGCGGGGDGGYCFTYIYGGQGGTSCTIGPVEPTRPTTCGSGGGGFAYNTTTAICCYSKGADGLIVIRYKTDGSCGILPSSLGGTKVTRGEWTIHCFTDTNGAQHFYPVYK